MKFFDLTNGKYTYIPKNIDDIIEKTVMSGMEDLNYPNDGFLYYRFGTISWKKKSV